MAQTPRKKVRGLILSALGIKNITADEVLEADRHELAAMLNHLLALYRQGELKHSVVITVNVDNGISVFSDLKAATLLILERGRDFVVNTLPEDGELEAGIDEDVQRAGLMDEGDEI